MNRNFVLNVLLLLPSLSGIPKILQGLFGLLENPTETRIFEAWAKIFDGIPILGNANQIMGFIGVCKIASAFAILNCFGELLNQVASYCLVILYLGALYT